MCRGIHPWLESEMKDRVGWIAHEHTFDTSHPSLDDTLSDLQQLGFTIQHVSAVEQKKAWVIVASRLPATCMFDGNLRPCPHHDNPRVRHWERPIAGVPGHESGA